MPKIFLHCPADTFTQVDKAEVISEMTTAALKLENIPDNFESRNLVWVYIQEYQQHNILDGNKSFASVVSVEVNVIKGRLNTSTKEKLIEQFTEIIMNFAKLNDHNSKPVYIVIREIEEENWGIFGKSIPASR